MSKIRSILFVELLGGIGDVLMALPAIHALARSHPAAKITVLTFAPGSELLQSDPLIQCVIDAKRGAARQSVDELIASQSFDLIVSDASYEGIADAIRSSSAHHTVTNLWRSPPDDELVSDRFLKILLAEGLITADATMSSAPDLHITKTERIAARQALGAVYRPLVVVCPDAGMPIKRWSTANFVALGQALQQQYGATVLVPIGSDQEQAEQIAAAIGGTSQVWQRGSLRNLAAVMAEADLVIAADTGPARVAAALNVSTITLFGPSWHGRYGQPTPHINLQGFPECPERIISNFTEQHCWYSGQCPFEWETCLEDISVEAVLEAVGRVLGGRRGGEGREDREGREGREGFSPIILTSPILPRWKTLRNLLVMRLDNIGDVIMTSPALRSLRENLPEAKITLMASPGGALTEPLLPWVDEVLPWRVLWQDLGRLNFDPAREWELIETLKQRQFDGAIIFTSFSQSPHPAGLICALAGIPLRLGESKEKDLGTLTHAVEPAPDDIHQVERNLRLIEAVGFEVRDRHLSLHTPNLQPPTSNPYIILNPWTSCQSRNYDPDRFATAARRLSDITGWSVVVTGVDKDRDRSQPILERLDDRAIDLIGKTDLSELVALIAGAKLVLTNNTSTMHIADATQTPNIVMFAGTELERQWQPRASRSRLLRRPTVCSPCYAFRCPYELQCLDISPETVVAAALKLLNIGDRVQEVS